MFGADVITPNRQRDPGPDPIESATSSDGFGHQFRELFGHRDLIVSFATRDIKARYKQTVLGAAWAVLQPLALMAMFTLVFSRFAKISVGDTPYPLFAYVSLIFWTFFAMIVTQGTVAIAANANLVRKIYFPREALLISIILSAGLDLSIAALILVAMLAYYEVALTTAVLWVLPLLALQTLLAFGIVCVTSTLYVKFRDIGHAIPLLLQVWLFATPVAYPTSLVPPAMLPVYLLNPLAPIIEGYRSVILTGTGPALGPLLLPTALTLALAGIGYFTFLRAQRTFADLI